MTEAKYTCGSCRWDGGQDRFTLKLLSIMFRWKHDSFQAFYQIICPKCQNLVTIIFNTMDASVNRRPGP